MSPIPFNRPTVVGKELEYIAEAIGRRHLAGNGPYTKRAQALLERAHGAPKVLLTTSCTDALEMSALLLGLRPGDEVIVPSFTFVSTANAFVAHGARPVFADVRADTLNLDEAKLERLITPRTRAIVPVHYAGVACEMDAIADIATRRGVAIVEDNAHGLFGTYQGRTLGTFGALSTLSFHDTKNFTCGEGGALVINDDRLVERAEIHWEKGTDRSRFFRGQVDKYTWVDAGSSYLPSEILAAFLFAQLEARDAIQATRRRIWERYDAALQPWAADQRVGRPTVPAHCAQAYHMYYLLMPTAASRQAVIAHLKSEGISAVFHYLPLHVSPMGQRFGGRAGDCPVTEDVSDRLVRLPFHNDLTDDEQARVVEVLTRFRCEPAAAGAAGTGVGSFA
ncbi:MAG: dTDP-4-amino-4,6-dideoxygalactose transaminase [Vicinamibacterales bacterium]